MSWQNALGLELSGEHGGWIPPEHRTPEQAALQREVDASLPTFDQVNGYGQTDLPSEALIPKLEIQVLGKLLPRIWQQTGSCVGAGGWQAGMNATIGDIAIRGDHEEPKLIFPWGAYGYGRAIGGFRGKGEGSNGGPQIRAEMEFGLLPLDHPGLPQPKEKDGWIYWSGSEEIAWSHSKYWPISVDELKPTASKNVIGTKAKITTTDEAARVAAQGYGISEASGFGSKGQRVVDGFLIGEWNWRWSHQESISGYTTHPSLGRIWWLQNQWFKSAHPSCPYMSKIGVNGGFWITDSIFQRIINGGETYARSNTTGFPRRNIPWGTMGII